MHMAYPVFWLVRGSININTILPRYGARSLSFTRTLTAKYDSLTTSQCSFTTRPMLFTTSKRHLTTSIDDMPQVVDWRNGKKVPGVFTDKEFDTRISKVRQYMTENNIGACVFTSYHNINYLCGFMYCSFGRSYGLVLTQDKSVVISAGIDGGQPWRRSSGSCDSITYTDWTKENFYYAVKSELKDVKGKIGLEFDHVTLDNFKKFQNALPKNELVEVGTPCMYMRMIKSQEEIDVIREAARIADIGGKAVVSAIKEGAMEHEIARAGTSRMIQEISTSFPYSDLMDTWVWFQSGINTDGAHNPVTSRKLQKGDILSLNCFPMVQGYYVALERTLFLEHANERNMELWDINIRVHERGLELLRPGVKCSDVAKELNEIYRQYDMLKYRSFGYGHSFGSLCHYYGREAALELREDIDTVIQPNMVISMEPMISLPESDPGAGGYREHDILVITENGAENITKFPYGPEHNIIKLEN